MRKYRNFWKRFLAAGLTVLLMGQSFSVSAQEEVSSYTEEIAEGTEAGQTSDQESYEENSAMGDGASTIKEQESGTEDAQQQEAVADGQNTEVKDTESAGQTGNDDSPEMSDNAANETGSEPADDTGLYTTPETGVETQAEQGNEEQQADPVVAVRYRAHCQSIGWQDWKEGGEQAGTTGMSKRLESLSIEITQKPVAVQADPAAEGQVLSGGIEYRAHCQTIGWQDWVSDGEMAGTTGMSKRLEAIQIRLTGGLAEIYDVYYQVHCAGFGDMGWAKNGEKAGTAGYSRSIEAITILLVKKGQADAPVQSGPSFLSPTEKGTLTYAAHVQDYGWMDSVADGAVCGTQGESKRMEALRIYLTNPLDASGQEIEGTIQYQAHSQTYGWMDWQEEGGLAGTSGESKRMEAIRIRLTDTLAEQYDVYYRVHSSRWGTLGWAKNGETAGTVGYYRSIESIEIKLVEKGSAAAPVQNTRACLNKENIGTLTYTVSLNGEGWQEPSGNQGTAGTTGQSKAIEALKVQIETGQAGSISGLYTGEIRYKAHLQGTGWQEFVTNGSEAGAAGKGKRLEAVQISLTGELEKYCDIYYRTHVQDYGWLGWAKNGQSAGTTNCSYRMEALQIWIIPKGAQAPGENADYFKDTKKPSVVKISEFSTVCTAEDASFFNMSKALAEFNGLVVQPGETVSFFGVAGPCGAAQGYMAAGIVGGIGYGGGICQASTTLYGGALRAGMTIVERRNHSVPSTYVPIGQDAMVSWGTSDFKFRNDYDFPVTLLTYVNGRSLYVEFWGEDPGWFDRVDVNSWYTGSRSAAAERVFYKNGVQVRIDSLPSSYY